MIGHIDPKDHPLWCKWPSGSESELQTVHNGYNLYYFSIHLILRNNYKNRHIPVGNWNPFTWLFNLVSCPNYTYELLAWIRFDLPIFDLILSHKFSFTAMTNCAIVGINTFIIFIQLFIWSAKKHSTYKKRFVAYPSNRRAFIPGIF